jgi:hypothetical protein
MILKKKKDQPPQDLFLKIENLVLLLLLLVLLLLLLVLLLLLLVLVLAFLAFLAWVVFLFLLDLMLCTVKSRVCISKRKHDQMAYDYGTTGEAVIKEIAAEDPRCLLGFSTGKDCIGAFIAIRDHFDIQPFYMYQVPGLEFIENSLDYYERTIFNGRRIMRLPHPTLIHWLNDMYMQPPSRLQVMADLQLAQHNGDDVNKVIKDEIGWPQTVMTALGVRAADSPQRHMHFKNNGPINRRSGRFYPVFDWNKARLLDEIRKSGIKLPVDYRLFGKSFDGLDLRFLLPIKKHHPKDYQTILEWFPMVELEIFRFEKRMQA